MLKRLVNAGALLILLCLLVLVKTSSEETLSADSREGAVLPVLMYHQLSENPKKWNDYVLNPEKFKADLNNLAKRGYTPVSVKEIADYANGEGELPEKPILITFDDGDESFYTLVYPLLQEYDVPALLSPVGQWVEAASPEGADKNGYVTFDQLNEMLDSGLVEIGNHTYAFHDSASRRGVRKKYNESDWEYQTALAADIIKAQRLWQLHLNILPDIFAYPFGYYTEKSEEIIRSLGFTVTFSCDEKINRISGPQSLYLLGRFNRPNRADSAAFLEKIDKLAGQA